MGIKTEFAMASISASADQALTSSNPSGASFRLAAMNSQPTCQGKANGLSVAIRFWAMFLRVAFVVAVNPEVGINDVHGAHREEDKDRLSRRWTLLPWRESVSWHLLLPGPPRPPRHPPQGLARLPRPGPPFGKAIA